MKCHGFRVMREECFLWGLGAVGGVEMQLMTNLVLTCLMNVMGSLGTMECHHMPCHVMMSCHDVMSGSHIMPFHLGALKRPRA